MNAYTPQKWLWTDADFEQMGWHDVVIHATAFEDHTFSLDIDYLFHWVDPGPGEIHYRYWLSPATWVFDQVSDLQVRLETDGGPVIMGVYRSEPETVPGDATTWQWLLDCLEGEISFRATGYRQFTRRPPVLSSKQHLPAAERGGISFARITPESAV